MLLLLLQEAQSADRELSKLALSFRGGQMEGFCCAWKDSLRARLLNPTQYWLCEILALANPPTHPPSPKLVATTIWACLKTPTGWYKAQQHSFHIKYSLKEAPPLTPSLPIPKAVTGSALINSWCWPSVLADHFVQRLIWICQLNPDFKFYKRNCLLTGRLPFHLQKNTHPNSHRDILVGWPSSVTLHLLAMLCCNSLSQKQKWSRAVPLVVCGGQRNGMAFVKT